MEIFTESQQNGMVLYVEREAERLNPEGFEVVSREMFSGENRPAVRLRNGSTVFNVYAIRKFGECSHIKMYMHPEKKMIIAKPCEKNEDNTVQWSRMDKRGRLAPKAITNKSVTARMYNSMKRDTEDTVRMLGAVQKIGEDKMLVFSF